MFNEIIKRFIEYFNLSPSAFRAVLFTIAIIILTAILPFFFRMSNVSGKLCMNENEIRKYDSALQCLTNAHSVQNCDMLISSEDTIPACFHTNYQINSLKTNEIDNNNGANNKSSNTRYQYSKRVNLHIEINTADSASLERLRGIGGVLAKRIIKYRNLLGGFYSQNQLLEVYGINNELINKLKNNLSIDTSYIVKFDLYKCEKSVLFKHPYIGKAIAYNILKYRSCYPNNTIQNMIAENILPHDVFEKLRPYLSNFK